MTKPSQMNKGDMFLYIPNYEGGTPEVYIKVETTKVQGREATIFVKNSALVRHLTSNYELAPYDNWAIGDTYYETMVKQGAFRPIDSIDEANEICPDFRVDF